MTVKDLIEKLQKMPQDAVVQMGIYAGGIYAKNVQDVLLNEYDVRPIVEISYFPETWEKRGQGDA